MSEFERTTDSWLQRHYGGKPKRLAFVDESFSNSTAKTYHPFYAVVGWTFQRRLIEREDWFGPFVGITQVYRPNGSSVAGFVNRRG